MRHFLIAPLLIGLTSPVHAHKISDHGFHCEKVIYRACKFDGVWSHVKKYTPNCDKSQFRNNNPQRIVKSCTCTGMDDHSHDYLK
mgnify:FL=1